MPAAKRTREPQPLAIDKSSPITRKADIHQRITFLKDLETVIPVRAETSLAFYGAADELSEDDIRNKGSSDLLTLERARRKASLLADLSAITTSSQEEHKRSGDHLPVTREANNPFQAFSFFSIPIVVDSKSLSASELKSELSMRGLSTTGTRGAMANRLDDYLRASESDLIVGGGLGSSAPAASTITKLSSAGHRRTAKTSQSKSRVVTGAEAVAALLEE
eukprot:GILI01030836.1.p1 GENE.GILI01030836.1~~GILI01030836.1.p1  ORF type:complete len:221 (-),score=5.10 GILI01030836.1:63-725(-)